MNKFIWRIRYSFHMWKIIGCGFGGFMFYWNNAVAWTDGLDWKGESPRDCALEEISNWYG